MDSEKLFTSGCKDLSICTMIKSSKFCTMINYLLYHENSTYSRTKYSEWLGANASTTILCKENFSCVLSRGLQTTEAKVADETTAGASVQAALKQNHRLYPAVRCRAGSKYRVRESASGQSLVCTCAVSAISEATSFFCLHIDINACVRTACVPFSTSFCLNTWA
jgi:hypothetical protein